MRPRQGDSRPFWCTPRWLIEELEQEYGSLFDPCPAEPDFDGLEIDWPSTAAAFVNPPYTRGVIGLWVEKCYRENVRTGQPVILLIPPYTDTAYFHDWILPHCRIRFLRGRLKFANRDYHGRRTAPFPSILCIWPAKVCSNTDTRS